MFTTLLAVAAIATLTTTANAAEDEVSYPDITVKAFTMKGCDMLSATPGLAELINKSAITLDIEPIEKAQVVKIEIWDPNDKVNPALSPFYVTTTDISTGKYTGTRRGATTKFYDNVEYTIILSAQTTQYPSATAKPESYTLARKEIKFKGATQAYQYSPVQFVSVDPADGSEVTNANQPVVVTFSAPVKTVECWATTGGQGAAQITMSDITPNADKTVWSINASAAWSKDGSDWTFYVSAKDANGLVVKGNHGVDAASDYTFILGCFINWPKVSITPDGGTVKQLYEFTVNESRGVGFAYNATPYVVNEAGTTVAKADLNSQVQYNSSGNIIPADYLGDVTAVKMTFHLDQAVTTPGKYTFIIPTASFSIGKEQSADFNSYMAIDYTVDTNVGVSVVGSHEFGIVSNGETLTVNGLEAGDTVSVYSLNGMKLAEKSVNGSAAEFNLPQGQVYVVKVNNAAVKVAH